MNQKDKTQKSTNIETDANKQTTGQFAANLMDTANTLIVILDRKATITAFNRYAEQLTGYTKNEVIGKNWFEVFIPERDRNSINEVFHKAIRKMPEVSQFENCIVLKNGEERLISWRNNTVHSNAADKDSILSIGIDVTGQKQTEQALRKSEKQQQSYLSAIDGIGLGLFVVDDDFHIRDMNHTMITWFGDQRGLICYESMAGLDQPCPYCKLKTVIQDRKTVKYTPQTSGERIFDIVATPIDNEDGGVSKLEIIRDITEQERILHKSKELSRTLEKRVQDRTQELKKKNIALRVLLDQQQETRAELEGNIATRLKKLVYPYLDLLREETTNLETIEYLAIITAHLDGLTTSFAKKLSNPLWQLTPKEILVADLVQQGKHSKEIGSILNISPRTAERHRNTIRKKIGLTKKKISLYAYLNTTTPPCFNR